jgi:hypothetical protein
MVGGEASTFENGSRYIAKAEVELGMCRFLGKKWGEYRGYMAVQAMILPYACLKKGLFHGRLVDERVVLLSL